VIQVLSEPRKLNNKEYAQKIKDLALQSLEEDKAEDIKVVDLDGKTNFAYFMIIASGRSAKHVSSLADKLADFLRLEGVDEISIEGKTKSDWVLVDAQDVITEYSLEKMWEI
jgi:ribosome-associated protein